MIIILEVAWRCLCLYTDLSRPFYRVRWIKTHKSFGFVVKKIKELIVMSKGLNLLFGVQATSRICYGQPIYQRT